MKNLSDIAISDIRAMPAHTVPPYIACRESTCPKCVARLQTSIQK